jgi:hypothetical protein
MLLIDWSKFLPALLLLLTPIALFHGKRVRHRALPQDWSAHWGRTFALGLHTIDFGRALLGAWYLTVALTARPGAGELARLYPLLAGAGVLAGAVVLQTFVCREPYSAHAPFAFVSGLVLGFLPIPVAAFALLLAIVTTYGTRAATAYFPVLGFATLASGLLFDPKKLFLPVLATAIVLILPWLLVLLFPRQWVVTHALKRVRDKDRKDDLGKFR